MAVGMASAPGRSHQAMAHSTGSMAQLTACQPRLCTSTPDASDMLAATALLLHSIIGWATPRSSGR
jgi:hypothetical protein